MTNSLAKIEKELEITKVLKKRGENLSTESTGKGKQGSVVSCERNR